MVRNTPHARTIFDRLLAALLVVAILFVGMDFHHHPGIWHGSDSGFSLTDDDDVALAAEKAMSVDHHAHSCVTLVAPDGKANEVITDDASPLAAAVPVLAGMTAAPPGRPPTGTILLS